MTDLTELLARIESAKPKDEADIFACALFYAEERGWYSNETNQMGEFWNADAYLNAVLLLLPEGWRVTHAYWDKVATFNLGGPRPNSFVEARNLATPALALLSAIMKARQSDD